MSGATGAGSGYPLPLVDVAAGADFVDQQRPIVQVGEENSPIADAKAVAILVAAFEVPYIAATLVDEKVNRRENPLLCWPVEEEEFFLGSSGPFDLTAHSVSLSSRLISSWDAVSPLARSVRPC